MGEVLLIALAVLIVLNVPIAFSIGAAAALAIWFNGRIPLFVVTQKMFTGMDSFALLAIPLFMIAGVLMERGGISRRLILLAKNCVGNIYGGLGIVTILASMFFSAISGSAPATVVAIGSIMIPAMIRDGYDPKFAVALAAAAGTTGFVIPPSIPLVTYGITMNASIGKLFAGGIVPGILMGLSMMLVCYLICRKKGYKSRNFEKLRPLAALKEASWGIMMPVIILGGIYGGFFTPTEAAAVACVYSLFVGLFIYKELTWKDAFKSFGNAAVPAAMVMMIIGCAASMSWIMTTQQIPVKITTFMTGLTDSTAVMLLILNIILLITGCLMEVNAAVILLGPIMLPILLQFGIDPVHFGVVMIVNLAIGLLTPPMGINLFVANGLRKDVPFKDVIVNCMPYLAILMLVLLAITYFPSIILSAANFLG